MGKQNKVSPYKGIVYSLEKEGNSDTLYNVNESWKHAKWNKSDTKGQVLYDSTSVRFLEKSNP